MGVIDTVKDLASLAKEVNRLDLNEKVVQLQMQVMEITEERYKLREERDQLREQLRLKDELVFDRAKGTYSRHLPDGALDGPYCARCFHTDHKIVPLKFDSFHQYNICPVCAKADGPMRSSFVGAIVSR